MLSYREMMQTYARVRGLRRLTIPVPVFAPRLSSWWLGLVTPAARVDRTTNRGEASTTYLVVTDPAPAQRSLPSSQ